ncbi:MAG: TonB-dependent receptor [Candidatus Oxydemutatoraceae bacterium WSBS_2016_MAG_OTU14]
MIIPPLTRLIIAVGIFSVSQLLLTMASAEETEKIIVKEQRINMNTLMTVSPKVGVGDIADAFNQIPGGAVNANGALSNVPQYRGLFGPRLNVRVNKRQMSPAGPAWMDPPLHYAPTALVKELEFQRGVAPVSAGSGLGGYMNVNLKGSEFVDSEKMQVYGSVDAHGHSINDGYNAGVFLGLSNRTQRMHFLGSRDHGQDAESADGPIDGTGYVKDTYGLAYGFRYDEHEFSLDYHRTITGDSGTPMLPLDIDFFHADFVDLGYVTRWGEYDIDVKVSVKDIEHRMDNYRLRSAPDFDLLPIPDEQKLLPLRGTDRRYAFITLEGVNASLRLKRPLQDGYMQFGFEGYSDEHNMQLHDPDVKPFFVNNFNGVDVDEIATFIEWSGFVSNRFEASFGMRYTHTRQSAGAIDALPARLADGGTSNPVTNAFQVLRDEFNARDLTQKDDTIDVVMSTTYHWDEQLSLTGSLAQKSRAPSYVERYLWVPLEITAGLGDGNNYIGNLDLEPEVSRGFDFGFDWKGQKLYLAPRIYHWWINDYIQGVAVESNACQAPFANAVETVSCVNGDRTPKQFANVDAKVYGMDVDFGYRFNDDWHVDGIASITRGRRRDINDNLFRISPSKLVLGLTREFDQAQVGVETVWVAEQDKLARSLLDADNLGGNIDTGATPGYALVNLAASYRSSGENPWFVSGGITNLFDKYYQDHTSGFNRRGNSSTPIGQKIPGHGRNVYIKLSYQW